MSESDHQGQEDLGILMQLLKVLWLRMVRSVTGLDELNELRMMSLAVVKEGGGG